jgi:Ca-activated chloride channel family protein
MGEGSSAYHLGDYPAALQQFTLAVLAANTNNQRADALFNLGNCYFQLDRFTDATAVFQDVLRYRSGDTTATHNLQLARKLARQQLQQQAVGSNSHQGRGPRTGRLDENQELSRGSLTLGNDDETEPFALSNKSSTGMTDDADRQLGTATLADDKISKIDDRNWDYAIGSAQDVALQDDSTKVDQSQLWQRLFESEEDIPAALDRPQTPAGVRPW